MAASLTDVVGLFALLVVLAAAVGVASAARRREDTFFGGTAMGTFVAPGAAQAAGATGSGSGQFSVDVTKLTDAGAKHMCGIASAQVEQVCDGDTNVARRLFFHDKSMHDSPWLGENGWALDGETGNNSDPYYMQKLTPSPNESSLRLTINDDANESFQIWGNACGTTGCGGEGVQQHKFRADGTASHSGSLVLGAPGTAADNGWVSGSYPSGGSLNIYNRHAGNWTHFPWVDGKNYIRNATQVDGTFTVAKGDGDGNWVHVAGNHGDDAKFGSDTTARGIVATGDRDFSIYNQGNRGLTVKTDGSLEMAGSKTHLQTSWHNTTCDGRMNLSSGEQMHLMPRSGVVVGREWGGTGNLTVQGDAVVGDQLCIGGTCITESDLKNLNNTVVQLAAATSKYGSLQLQETTMSTQAKTAAAAQANFQIKADAQTLAQANAVAQAQTQARLDAQAATRDAEEANRQAVALIQTQTQAKAKEVAYAAAQEQVASQAQAIRTKVNNAIQANATNGAFDLGPYNMGPWNAWNFQDPSAHWIWSERGAAGNAATGWCVAFQKVFNSPWNTGATVHVICDDSAVVYLNGDYVGRGDGGWGGGNYNRLPVTLYADNNVLHIEGVNGGGPAGLLASVIADNGTVLARTDSSWTWVYNCTKGGPLSDAQLQARSVVGNNGSVSCDRYCHGINRAPWNWELPYSWNGARGVGPAYPQDAGGICICQKTGGGWS